MKAINQQKVQQITSLRMQRMLHHWLQYIMHQQQLTQQIKQAQLWHRCRKVRRGFETWFSICQKRYEKADDVALRQLEAHGKAVVQVNKWP